MYKKILLLLSMLLFWNHLVLAQYTNHTLKDYGKTDKNNVVVIENQEIVFDDAGVRVVGIAANLLGVDYYYRLGCNNQNNIYTPPPLGYNFQQYQNLQPFNNYNQINGYNQNNQCNQLNNYGQTNQLGQPNYNSTQPALNNDLAKYAIDRLVDKFAEQIGKDCFGLKPGVKPVEPGPNPNPNPSPNPTPPNVPNTLDADVFKIFNTSCVACHSGDKPSKGLSLITKDNKLPTFTLFQYTEIVDRVTGGGGVQPNEIMPRDGPRLTDEEVETLRKWVREKKKNLR